MRRAILALMGTAAGTMLLVGAKAGFSSPSDQALKPQSANGPAPGAPASGTLPPGAAAPPQHGAGAPAAGGPKATTQAPPGGTKTTAPAGTKPTTAVPKPPRTTMKDGTFAGSSIYVEYGNVELSIVVSGGKITDVKVLDSPSEHSRSVQINKNALPRLRSETLAAQSADIDTVSGATYTSSGYEQSLQSAIDRAYQA